jgi:hypothetical protein
MAATVVVDDHILAAARADPVGLGAGTAGRVVAGASLEGELLRVRWTSSLA